MSTYRNTLETVLSAKYKGGAAFGQYNTALKSSNTLLGNMGGAVNVLSGAAAGLSVAGLASSAVRAAAEFQTLEARLNTITRNELVTGAVFRQSAILASQTGLAVAEIVDAYGQLDAQGLNPTIAAIEAMGNVAVTTGKSVDQFVQAIGDATRGQFDRLPEFGISARNQGETIAFTFQNMTTEVENSSRAINTYLTDLGNVQFAGAIRDQADTIQGSIDKATGAFQRLLAASANESALTAGVVRIADGAALIFNNLNGSLVPLEQLQTQLSELDTQLREVNKLDSSAFASQAQRKLLLERYDLQKRINLILAERQALLQAEAAAASENAGPTTAALKAYDTLSQKLQNTALKYQELSETQRVEAELQKTIYSSLNKEQTEQLRALAAANDELDRARDASQSRARAEKEAAASAEKLLNSYQSLQSQLQNPIESIVSSLAAKDQLISDAVEKTNVDIAAGLALRQKLFSDAGNTLAETIGQDIDLGEVKQLNNLEAALQQQFDRLAAIADQYSLDEDLVSAAKTNLTTGFDTRETELAISQAKELKSQYEQLQTILTTPTEQVQAQLQNNLIKLENVYQGGNQFDLNEESEFLAARNTLYKAANDELSQIEQARRDMEIDAERAKYTAAADLLGSFASLAQTYGKRGFQASKNLQYAQTVISTIAAAQDAFKWGMDYGGPAAPALAASAAAAAIAAGLARARQIKATTYNGGGGAASGGGGGGVSAGGNAAGGAGGYSPGENAFDNGNRSAAPNIQIVVQGSIIDSEGLRKTVAQGLNESFDRGEMTIEADQIKFASVA